MCWCPTWRGWILLLAGAAIAGRLVLTGIHPFLAVNSPVTARVLVVEGWGSDSQMQRAVTEFRTGAYETIFVTGVPLERGEPFSEFKNWAAHGAARLVRYGLETNRVIAVPGPAVQQDRTYASALALRRWLESHGGVPPTLNILTGAAHARRSRLLFREAFGDAVRIGVITHLDTGYDPDIWWRSSIGVRVVIDETVAWLYARLWFKPSAAD